MGKGEEMMRVYEDRRHEKRFSCKIPIVVSVFHSNDPKDALLVNHSIDGISFLSKHSFFVGTAIVIRIPSCALKDCTLKDCTLKDSSSSDLETLSSIRIGEVIWCRGLPDDASTPYEVGIKYYPEVY
jgi:hypothetical protein